MTNLKLLLCAGAASLGIAFAGAAFAGSGDAGRRRIVVGLERLQPFVEAPQRLSAVIVRLRHERRNSRDYAQPQRPRRGPARSARNL